MNKIKEKLGFKNYFVSIIIVNQIIQVLKLNKIIFRSKKWK